MDTISIQYFKTPVGELILGSFKQQLCICDWRYRKMRSTIDNRIQKGLNAIYKEGNTDLINVVIQQLNEYFNDERKEFDIQIRMLGTDFQQQVWNELLKIPFGKTKTYLELSQNINNEKAIRAVASANGANALSIIIPCHRIIGSEGDLVGYAGGLSVKKRLLQLESNNPFVEQLQLFG